MDIFKELHDRMDYFAENIAAEVAEKRYYEIAEVKAIAKTRLWFAITDCLELQVTDAENRRRLLIDAYGKPGLPQWRKLELASEISKVNSEKGDANRLLHTMQDYSAFEQMKNYIRQQFGQDSLESFFNSYYNLPENRKRKGAIKHLKP